ncbi:MAG TPA: hypothetical protein VG496_08510, partial [Myxococcales bacterium]|nr:hypothetical protein [Myxococcales bacterium]
VRGPFVDGRAGNAQQSCDIADREHALDSASRLWQQIGSKISRKLCESLRRLDANAALDSSHYESLRIVDTRWDGRFTVWGASGRWFKSSRPDQLKAPSPLGNLEEAGLSLFSPLASPTTDSP